MSAATASRSPFQSHVVSDESYCSPWDLKSQEEKFKLLSEKRSTSTSNTITALTDALPHPSNTNHRTTSLSSSSTSSSSNNNNNNNNNNSNNPFQRTRSARTSSSTKKSFTLCEPSPPILPPLPPGGLIPLSTNITCQCGSTSANNTRNRSFNNTNNNNNNNNSNIESLDPSLKKISYCLNAHTVRSGTDTSRSFVFASSSPANERSQRINTAPAKVDLSHIVENQQEPINTTSQNSTISSLSTTTTSSSIESPLITDDTKPMSLEVGPFLIRFCLHSIINDSFLRRLLYNGSND